MLVWDITFAPSRPAWWLPKQKKIRKYAELLVSHYFAHIAIETGGVYGPAADTFFRDRPNIPVWGPTRVKLLGAANCSVNANR